jgi:hypothetical protein
MSSSNTRKRVLLLASCEHPLDNIADDSTSHCVPYFASPEAMIPRKFLLPSCLAVFLLFATAYCISKSHTTISTYDTINFLSHACKVVRCYMPCLWMMMCFKQEKEVEGSVAECSHWVGSYSTYRGISSISSIINNIRECIYIYIYIYQNMHYGILSCLFADAATIASVGQT